VVLIEHNVIFNKTQRMGDEFQVMDTKSTGLKKGVNCKMITEDDIE
jgi:hypothetical protein